MDGRLVCECLVQIYRLMSKAMERSAPEQCMKETMTDLMNGKRGLAA